MISRAPLRLLQKIGMALIFAALCAAIASWGLHLAGRELVSPKTLTVMAIAAIAGGTGHLFTHLLLYFLPLRRPTSRFIAAAILLSGILLTAFTGWFALQYVSQFGFTEAPPFSRHWLYYYMYTGFTALAGFAVIGLRLMLPWIVILIILDAAIFAWRRN